MFKQKQLFLGIILFCVVTAAGAAACDAPGEGKKAERGYALCQPVIEALAEYYDQNGEYPDHLDLLTPGYIDQVPDSYDGFPVEYEKTGESYSLTFSYQRPGMNQCVYTPETGWESYGYF